MQALYLPFVHKQVCLCLPFWSALLLLKKCQHIFPRKLSHLNIYAWNTHDIIEYQNRKEVVISSCKRALVIQIVTSQNCRHILIGKVIFVRFVPNFCLSLFRDTGLLPGNWVWFAVLLPSSSRPYRPWKVVSRTFSLRLISKMIKKKWVRGIRSL